MWMVITTQKALRIDDAPIVLPLQPVKLDISHIKDMPHNLLVFAQGQSVCFSFNGDKKGVWLELIVTDDVEEVDLETHGLSYLVCKYEEGSPQDFSEGYGRRLASIAELSMSRNAITSVIGHLINMSTMKSPKNDDARFRFKTYKERGLLPKPYLELVAINLLLDGRVRGYPTHYFVPDT